MSWNPNQGQDPNQPNQYGGYTPPQQGTPRVSPLGPSSIGMDPNVSAGLGYLVVIVGLIFFFIEKQNRFVRFHTLQSVLLAASEFVLFFLVFFVGLALAFVIPGLGALILVLGYTLLPIAFFVGWLVAMIYAFQGKYLKLPLIGDMAERWSGSGITGM